MRVTQWIALIGVLFTGHTVMATTIEFEVNGKSYPVTLQDNDATQSFLKQLPLNVVFEDYGSIERITYLNQKLNIGSAPTSMTPRTGDFTYYKPWGNLAIFMHDFRHSDGLVPLGKMSPEALKAIKTCGDAIVVIKHCDQ